MGQSVAASVKIEELSITRNSSEPTHTGVEFPRHFTSRLEDGKTPYDEVQWETRTATIGNDKGSIIFEQRDIEVPADWSQTATNIVASKYFHGKLGSPDRERSVAELVHRVVDTIADWGIKDGYFAAKEDGENFRNELAHLMLHQKAAFNSPVWFNVGVKESRGYGWFYESATDSARKLTSEAAVFRLFYCFGEGFARVDSGPRQDGRHAVQVGLRHRFKSLRPTRRGRDSLWRWPCVRSAFLHEGL
jgi:ribonucleoside-diphosphate reductase alpha chain